MHPIPVPLLPLPPLPRPRPEVPACVPLPKKRKESAKPSWGGGSAARLASLSGIVCLCRPVEAVPTTGWVSGYVPTVCSCGVVRLTFCFYTGRLADRTVQLVGPKQDFLKVRPTWGRGKVSLRIPGCIDILASNVVAQAYEPWEGWLAVGCF